MVRFLRDTISLQLPKPKYQGVLHGVEFSVATRLCYIAVGTDCELESP